MKYVNNYKLFESINDIKNLIEDAFIDISDDGISVKVALQIISGFLLIDVKFDHYDTLKGINMTKYFNCFEILNDIIDYEGYKCYGVDVYLTSVFNKILPPNYKSKNAKEFKNINNLLNPENVTSKDFKWSNWYVHRIFIQLEKIK